MREIIVSAVAGVLTVGFAACALSAAIRYHRSPEADVRGRTALAIAMLAAAAATLFIGL